MGPFAGKGYARSRGCAGPGFRLRRNPGFAAAVVVTLGLGIGANAVMFGVLDRIMFRPFPYLRDPKTVHKVYIESQGRNGPVFHTGYEYTRYLDL